MLSRALRESNLEGSYLPDWLASDDDEMSTSALAHLVLFSSSTMTVNEPRIVVCGLAN